MGENIYPISAGILIIVIAIYCVIKIERDAGDDDNNSITDLLMP